ncbi:protein mono-ADP-ribosyltransferase PARP12 isoform X2 [Trachinotus anak]|uniref:protein mono-ADP-ribosyltransferase PARP12 isoform X2 n=1 Tax=Trachinotus anak TaxID=443729 RepID=UPI0039F22B1B
MTSVISKFVIKTLCDHRGCLDFQHLDETLAQSFTVAEPVLRSVLYDDGKIAIKTGREKATGGQIINPDSLVVAKTSLRICQKKPGECPRCDGLHLCRYFVCGDCTFGQKCKNPHSLASPYNVELLKKYGLQDLTEKQLFQLLLQNDPYLLPEICPHYNKGNGAHGSCRFGISCTKLHVCLHYFQGDLSPKVKIPTQQPPHQPSHEVTHQATQRPSHSNPGSPASSSCPSKPTSDADRNEICLYFIRRHCRFNEKCVRVHWHLPYRWQVLDSDGVTWKELPNMEDIERAYCDPGRDTNMDQPLPISGIFSFFGLQSSAQPIVQAVDFKTMTYEGSPVRRLSTASSVSKPPHYILTTQWLWYWKDDTGKWLEFGQGDGDTPASVTSETLENVYLADRDTEIPFGAGKQQYILNFKGKPGTPQMYQENLKYKTKREVRRRPRFVSAHDVKVKLESASSPSSSSSTVESVPSHWDKSALPDFGYKLVPLSKSMKDHDMIEMLFKRTLPQSKINSIKRIQNPSLWKVFQWQKDQMKVRNGGTDVNQLYLFHGTDESLIEAICEQNFDWRMCGVHGTAYGKGSYFARDASYSDRYASIKRSQNKIMFVALVLVGEYSRGRSNFVRPPPKDGRTLYDSCVDSESNPSIYVVFEKQQIYPEYVIDYS